MCRVCTAITLNLNRQSAGKLPQMLLLQFDQNVWLTKYILFPGYDAFLCGIGFLVSKTWSRANLPPIEQELNTTTKHTTKDGFLGCLLLVRV